MGVPRRTTRSRAKSTRASTNSTLTGANLTDTVLFGATLDDALIDGATLTGTDLLETSLRCTDLSDNDLTDAKFATQNDPIAAVTDPALTDDSEEAVIIGIEPTQGDRFVLSGPGVGDGDAISEPFGITSDGAHCWSQTSKVSSGSRAVTGPWCPR